MMMMMMKDDDEGDRSEDVMEMDLKSSIERLK